MTVSPRLCASICSRARSALSVARMAENRSALHHTLVSIDKETGMLCRVYVDSRRGHESMVIHHTDTIIFGDAPHTGMGCHRQVEVTRRLESRLFGEGRVASHVKGNLHTQHISAPIDTALDEIGKLRRPCPLPGRS